MRKKNNNIILTGFMGCGKTSIGKRLAVNHNLKFIDTDAEIQDLSGMCINDIFSTYGEPYFRKLERNFCKLLAINNGFVVATGGGVIKDENNIDNLKLNGAIVYLKCSPEKIYKNIKNDTTRPLLNNTNDKFALICSMLKDREPFYKKYADFIIDISDMRLEETAWQVGRELRRLGFI